MAYIKLFFADGTEVSPQGTFTNAIEFKLRADLEESDEIRLYAIADTGYKVTGVTASLAGTTAAKWNLAPDNTGASGTYGAAGAALTLGDVTTTKTYFWAKAKATSDETPVKDTTVTLQIEGVAEAV